MHSSIFEAPKDLQLKSLKKSGTICDGAGEFKSLLIDVCAFNWGPIKMPERGGINWKEALIERGL